MVRCHMLGTWLVENRREKRQKPNLLACHSSLLLLTVLEVLDEICHVVKLVAVLLEVRIIYTPVVIPQFSHQVGTARRVIVAGRPKPVYQRIRFLFGNSSPGLRRFANVV